jgi:hypothetical protein
MFFFFMDPIRVVLVKSWDSTSKRRERESRSHAKN